MGAPRNRAPRGAALAASLAALVALAATGAALPRAAAAPARGPAPPTMNPYADLPYAHCDGGYCAAADPAAEAALLRAAAAGDTEKFSALAAGGTVNLTRNIVPDADGFVRLVDAALWAAAKHGRAGVVKAILDAGYDGDLEDGHTVDLAAANGDTAMLATLIDRGFAIGSSSLAYAAKHHNADMMRELISAAKRKAKGREPDLKAAMQAACAAGNETVLRVLVDEGGFKELIHPVSKRPAVHDWRGDYVAEAVATGHPLVLELLFKQGYEITWQNAQELVKLAARVGNPDTLRHLMAQKTIAEDSDELEESVDNALKVAAEEGKGAIVEYLLSAFPKESKEPCPAAILKATMYGHSAVVRSLQRACNVSASSARLQAAGWLGALFGAARGGHALVARLLLAHEGAPGLLGKLYPEVKAKKGAAGDKSTGPPRMPDPEKDPLGAAAGRGHTEIVELLSPHRALCAPCAAASAAAGGHVDAFVHLAAGPAESILKADEDHIHEAMRAAALAMEGGHWGVLRALLSGHDSDKLGPYFLPAVAQQGNVGDLDKLLELIEDVGADADYVTSQLSSAMVTAALSGYEGMLLTLTERRDAYLAAGAAAAAARDGGGGGGGDKSEL